MFRGFAPADGRAVAVWRFGGTGIELTPFPELFTDEIGRALAADIEPLLSFLGR